MQKDNQFRSSLFHMDVGDILHMRIIDEGGTPLTVTLNTQYADGTNNEEEVPIAPIALEATDITAGGFTANWNYTENTLGYYLDVATDSAFTSMVAGYDNLDVGFVEEYDVVGLSSYTDYFYRLIAYNDYGESDVIDSNIISLETIIGDEIVIGTQTWKTRNVADNIALSKAPYNDEGNRAVYGGLYLWSMIGDVEALYPGWHVPTVAEIVTLETFLGGSTIAARHLKETGSSHWQVNNNFMADNSSGFTALGAGYYIGSFPTFGQYAIFMSSTQTGPGDSRFHTISMQAGNEETFLSDVGKVGGYVSIRLIKD